MQRLKGDDLAIKIHADIVIVPVWLWLLLLEKENSVIVHHSILVFSRI